MRYDLIVIGNSPSGQHGAVTAAKLHKRVALIDNQTTGLGTDARSGSIPSKALREAILLLTGFRHRAVFPDLFERRDQLTFAQLQALSDQVVKQEAAHAAHQLRTHGVEAITGTTRFVSPHEVDVSQGTGNARRLTSDRFLIAVGSQPTRPNWIPFDGQTIVDTDGLLTLNRIPRSMIVVGGGVVGLEYAMMFAVLGTQVGVVDQKARLLDFCDHEMTALLLHNAEQLGVRFRLGERVIGVERARSTQAAVRLEGGHRLLADTVLYAAGRRGNTEAINLPAAGLTPDEQGRLWCNEHYQTWIKHIYGVGDVVGFPALASMALEQGRHAVQHAFGQRVSSSKQIPYGLFTVPELAMVGPTEERLRDERVPYEVGVANFQDVPRGHIAGSPEGLLKLLFDRESLQLLAVHCLGESATELIHVGQTVMSFGGTIEYFRDAVFSYPTMAECYKVAATNALNQHETERAAVVTEAVENDWVFDELTAETDFEANKASDDDLMSLSSPHRHRHSSAKRHAVIGN